MKALLAALALPAILAGCLAGEPDAGAPMGQIDGAVVDHLLRPFANQSVLLVQQDRIDHTSRLGGFSFRGVPAGVYTVATNVGARSAAEVVEVDAGKITRVILQLHPVQDPLPVIDGHAFQTESQIAQPNQECTVCSWSQALQQREAPAEVTLQGNWQTADLAGKDTLQVRVTDQDGIPLYQGPMADMQTITIAGADIPAGARDLFVRAHFGSQFTPQVSFTMVSVMTVYYGATKDQIFAP